MGPRLFSVVLEFVDPHRDRCGMGIPVDNINVPARDLRLRGRFLRETLVRETGVPGTFPGAFGDAGRGVEY